MDPVLLARIQFATNISFHILFPSITIALGWVLRLPVVTSALIGASSVAQLDQNLDAMSAPPLAGAEIDAIEAVLR